MQLDCVVISRASDQSINIAARGRASRYLDHFMLHSLRLSPTVASRSSRQFAKAIAPRRRLSAETSDGLQRFPGGVWAVVRPSSSGVLLEAGWLIAPDLRRVASRAFAADGRLLHTSFAAERRGAPAGAV